MTFIQKSQYILWSVVGQMLLKNHSGINDLLWGHLTPSEAGLVHVPNFGGLSGSEDRGGGNNSIQFINFGRVGDKSFEEWRQKIGGWKGG